MKTIRTITLFICLIATINDATGQQPRAIRARGDYTHTPTKMTFPTSLFGDYQRETIRSFDRRNQNIGVSYGKNQNGERTMFTLYLYPAEDGYEGRLRREYQNSLHSAFLVMKKQGLHARQYAIQHKGEKYICNGFEAIFTNDNNDLSQLTVFESGTWFYKIRITSNQNDTTFLSDLKTKILQVFDPTVLADLTLLNEKVDIYMHRAAFRDSVLLGSAIGSALAKSKWILENVDEKEKATGMPDLYLDFHIAGLKEFMEFQHRSNYINYKKSDFTENYLRQLQLISDADFLNEFVMEQYGMILIIPKDIPDKYDEYLQWKAQNDITIKLNDEFYVLSFKAKK